jgi:hypothetical protein
MHLSRASVTLTIFESERKRKMRRLITLIGFVTIFAALALAENFTGRLIDASCADQPQKGAAACAPTAATTAFAVQSAGKVYKLDDTGNAKASEALKSRADRSADPNSTMSSAVVVKISGTKDGDTIKVETLAIQ